MENFTEELASIFTMMCREKNCPVTFLRCQSRLPARQTNLNCPFQREQECQDITDDDWLYIITKNACEEEKISK